MKGLTSRLLIFNLLLAVFPVGATLFLGTYEKQLLDSQERAMVQQGRLLASALEGNNLESEAEAILSRLGKRNDSRLRVVDQDGRLLADSAQNLNESDSEIQSQSESPQIENASEDYPQQTVIYRIGALPSRTIRYLRRFFSPPEEPQGESEYYINRDILDGLEIQAALSGRYGATTRISQGQISVTLYSAIPIHSGDEVIGAVLVSRSTFAILDNLYRLRLDIMNIFLFGIVAAILLSVLLARTVTVPVGRLRDQAESLLDARGKLQANFKPLSRKDEVADLSRALHRLSKRLQERTDSLENFIADLVHEMKNPVAGILSASELADRSADTNTKRFLKVIDREGRRIQLLMDDLKELISIDVRLNQGREHPMDINDLLRIIVDASVQQHRDDVQLLYIDPPSEPVYVYADPDRIAQALLNLVDNAISFSPPQGRVEIHLDMDEKTVSVSIADEGPGVPQDAVNKIFERWYTDRPDSRANDHTGLGLAIVRSIATGYGGRVSVHQNTGAVFVLQLPRSFL